MALLRRRPDLVGHLERPPARRGAADLPRLARGGAEHRRVRRNLAGLPARCRRERDRRLPEGPLPFGGRWQDVHCAGRECDARARQPDRRAAEPRSAPAASQLQPGDRRRSRRSQHALHRRHVRRRAIPGRRHDLVARRRLAACLLRLGAALRPLRPSRDGVRDGRPEDPVLRDRWRALRFHRRDDRPRGAGPRLRSDERGRGEPPRVPGGLREGHAGVVGESGLRGRRDAGQRHPGAESRDGLGPEHLRSVRRGRRRRRRGEPRHLGRHSRCRPQLLSAARTAPQRLGWPAGQLHPLQARPSRGRFARHSLLRADRLRRRGRGRADLPHLHRSARQRHLPLGRGRRLDPDQRHPGPQPRRNDRSAFQELRGRKGRLPSPLHASAGRGRVRGERLARRNLRDAGRGNHVERSERPRDESAATGHRHQRRDGPGVRSDRSDRHAFLGRERSTRRVRRHAVVGR